MKSFKKPLILGIFCLSLLLPTASVLAYFPVLNTSLSGGGLNVSISGAQPNASVVVTYRLSASSISNTVTGSTDYSGGFLTYIGGADMSTQVSASVGGQTVSQTGGYGGCTYNCGSPTGLSLSQSSLSLSVGQSQTVTIYNNSYNGYSYNNYNYYISSNSNSGVATASVNGNSVNIYAQSAGSASISICQNNGGQCVTLNVIVSGYGSCGYGNCVGGLTLNPTNVSVNVGQYSYVTASMPIYNPSFYISSNSNPSAVSASVSGSQISLYGLAAGSSTVSVCSSGGSACASAYVTVGGGGYGGGNVWFSPSSATMYSGQSLAVSINSGTYSGAYSTGYSNVYYISSNSNPAVVSASLSGTVLNLYANQSGNSNITVCLNSLSFCGTMPVTVSGSVLGASAANVMISDNYFNPRTITMPVGSTITWTNNGSMTHTVTADDNSFNSGNLGPGATFSRTFYAVGTYPYHCIFHGGSGGVGMSGVIVISGNSYGGNPSVWFSPSSVNLNFGQSQAVTIYSNNNYNNYNNYYITSNSNSGAVSASVSGNTLNLYGQGNGSSIITVCQSGYGNCGTLNVTVGGGYYGGGGYSGGCSYNCGGLQYPGSGGVLGAATYQSGQLIAEGSTVYMVYKNTKTGFASVSAFRGLGFNFGNVLQVGSSGLSDSGYTVSSGFSSHPWGSWIKGSGSTVYFVSESGLIPVPNYNTFINNGGQLAWVVRANSADFRLPMLSVMVAGDPRLR